MSSVLISPEEAAQILGINPPTVREWLKDSSCPFGHAVKCAKSWRYIIIRERFERYISGADMLDNTRAKPIPAA